MGHLWWFLCLLIILPTKQNNDVVAQLMRKESTNHRNGFLMEKPCLLLTQRTRNFEFAIGKKPLVSMGLMQHSPLVKLSEGKRKKLLLEDTTTVKYSYCR
jgi:hypothetical protein